LNAAPTGRLTKAKGPQLGADLDREFKQVSARLQLTHLRDVLGVFVEQLKLDDAHFAVAELEQMLTLAEQLDSSAARLSLKERFIYAQAPVDTRTDSQLQAFLDWAAQHAFSGQAGSPWFLDQVDSHSRREAMEQALRGLLNDGIERQLKGKRPLAQMRNRQRRGG
jgi:ATP-dependent RNA helicase SUPV3L1/SUV3